MGRRALVLVLALPAALLAPAAAGGAPSPSPGERVAVIVTGERSSAARGAVGAFRVRHELPLVRGFSATMAPAQARALAAHRGVRVSPVRTMHALDEGTTRDFGVAAARADRPGLDGSGVGICVVDTGIDPGHEQVAPRPVVFRDFIGAGTTAYDDQGHGTHVAAIAAGDGVGGASAAAFGGVAPAASLYAAKVLDGAGSGPNDGVLAGVQWCAAQPGVRVISMSLGDDAEVKDGSDPVSLGIDAAVDAGKVVVVAAGNSGDSPGTVSAPGTARKAITVGAVAEHSNPVGTDRHDDGMWLAAFSSRGPTADGRAKPEIVAPGVTVRSALANSTAGYVTHSGTSMATPFVAGAVALALDAAPAAGPAQVRSAIVATAVDVGAPGTDPEWGAGVIDSRALVDAVAGAATPRSTPMPQWTRVSGTVPDHGEARIPIPVSAEALGVPLAVTVTLAGQGGCVMILGVCWPVEWSPDLDVELLAPDGATVLSRSECALSGIQCGFGRQEIVAARPTVAGTYWLRVFTFEGGPDDGAGGAFVADVSQGPLGGAALPPPPPPPANTAPVADAGPDQAVTASRKTRLASFTLSGSGSTDADGDPLAYRWTEVDGGQVGTSSQVTLQRGPGVYTFELVVSDGNGGTDTDRVVVTVAEPGGKGGSGGGGGGSGGGGGGGHGGGPK